MATRIPYNPQNPNHYAPLLDLVDSAVLEKVDPTARIRKVFDQLGIGFTLAARADMQAYLAEFYVPGK